MSYTITNSNLTINIDGITGTTDAGISYSLVKANIARFVTKASINEIAIVMIDNTAYPFVYSELINPLTSAAFVSLAVCEALLEDFVNNTDASGVLVSTLLTPLAATKVCNQHKQGYVILQTPLTNVGIINFGASNVGATSAGLDPGQSIVIESGYLDAWYVKNVTATDVVSVSGEYKS